MAADNRQTDFEKRIGQALRQHSDQLDAATRSRLARARSAAIDELRDNRFSWRNRWLPLGAAAAAAVVVALLLSPNSPVPVPDSSTRIEPLEDLDIVLAEDSLELIEDWEFYRWLEDVQDVG